MRVTCPACHAEMSLDALLGREADARALAEFIAGNVPLGALLISYIALFRPGKRRLSLARTAGLFDELRPDLQRHAITRKGRDWAAPQEVWRSAIEQVISARDKGTLSLPLTSHGYLYEVMVGHADKSEGAAERDREQARSQAGRARPNNPGPVNLAGVAELVAAVTSGAVLPPPYDAAKGPSRHARETKARIDAIMAARNGQPTDDPEAKKP